MQRVVHLSPDPGGAMSSESRTAVSALPSTTAAPPVGGAERPRPARPYLHQVNLFRILTFVCVIGVHVIDRAGDPDSVTGNGAMLLLHFPRQAFFALTAFVLVYQYAHRSSFDARHFWRRRFMLVGIPYVVWSVFYWGYSIVADIHQETAAQAVGRLALELVTGEAWYQLYFLLVSMQIYLLFPLILRLVRRTAGHHGRLLAVSAIVQLGLLWVMVNPPTLSGVAVPLWEHLYVTILPYQFYVVLGAVAAWHIEQVDRIVRRFGPVLLLGTVLAAAGAEWCYLHAVAGGTTAWESLNVFNPYMAVYFVALIAGLYTVSSAWGRIQPRYRFAAAISRYGTDRSFAVFLVHPIVLEAFLPLYPKVHDSHGPVAATLVVFLAVLATTMVLVEMLRRAPGSIWLTGRARIPFPAALVQRLRSVRDQYAAADADGRDNSAERNSTVR